MGREDFERMWRIERQATSFAFELQDWIQLQKKHRDIEAEAIEAALVLTASGMKKAREGWAGDGDSLSGLEDLP